jgi:LmbE family N-acetylglucosaminyl deacetylase
MEKKKVLVIVAHPDDETIWMGGTLLKNKYNWDTTIISLCRKKDIDRAPKFGKVCLEYNARGFMSDLDDSEEGDYKKINSDDIIKRILQYSKGSYDYVFTHGENGEYGHPRHKEVHNAVIEMFKKKKLKAEHLLFFSYIKTGRYIFSKCANKASADKFIRLEDAYHKMKKQLIEDKYGFKKNSFESRCCLKVESFENFKG